MTRITSLAAAAMVFGAAVAPVASAELLHDWELKTANAYFSVYSYNCAPYFYDLAASPGQPSSMEIAIYSDTFRVDYGSDCRAFYLGEIIPRLDPNRIETVVFAGN